MVDSGLSTVGVIANYPHHIHAASIIKGVKQIADRHGLNVVATPYTGPDQQAVLAMHMARMTGIIIVANAVPDDFALLLHSAYNKPIVLIAHHIPNSGLAEIAFNNQLGIQLLVNHLAERCGRRHLVFIQGIPSQRDSQERQTAFQEEIHRYALHVPESHYLRGDYLSDVAAQSVRELIAGRAQFDAILAADYVMAAAAVHVLREARLRVPKDVSVVGFGDGAQAEAVGLTTVSADVVELGARATRVLLSQINRIPTAGVTLLNPGLVIRDTCGYKQEPTLHEAG